MSLGRVLICVRDPKRIHEDVVYHVELRDIGDRRALHVVQRTYKDLKTLLKRYGKPELGLPVVPRTPVIGPFDTIFVEERRGAIEAFLNAVLELPEAADDVDFLMAIGFSEYAAARAAAIGDDAGPDVADADTDTSLLTVARVPPIDPATNQSDNFTAARFALRSTSYTIAQLLPPLGIHEGKRRSYALVKNGAGESFLLSITLLGPLAAKKLDKKERGDCLERLLKSLDPKYFARVMDVFVAHGRLYTVREVHHNGSLLDQLHRSWGPSALMNIKDKRSRKPAPMPLERVAAIGFRLLQILTGLHQFDLTAAGFLSPGNILIDADGAATLADSFENIVAGLTRVPIVPPSRWAEDRTHIDILMLGALLLQCALGIVFEDQKLLQLLCVQGDFCNRREPNAVLPEGKQVAVRLLPNVDKMPEVFMNLVYYIFHPSHVADSAALLAHPFFEAERAAVLDAVAAEGTDEAGEQVAMSPIDEDGVPLFRFKRKDLALHVEAADRWAAELNEREELRQRIEATRSATRAEAGKHASDSTSPSLSPRAAKSGSRLAGAGMASPRSATAGGSNKASPAAMASPRPAAPSKGGAAPPAAAAAAAAPPAPTAPPVTTAAPPAPAAAPVPAESSTAAPTAAPAAEAATQPAAATAPVEAAAVPVAAARPPPPPPTAPFDGDVSPVRAATSSSGPPPPPPDMMTPKGASPPPRPSKGPPPPPGFMPVPRSPAPAAPPPPMPRN